MNLITSDHWRPYPGRLCFFMNLLLLSVTFLLYLHIIKYKYKRMVFIMEIRENEVWLCDIPKDDTTRHKQFGKRPVLVVSNTINNKYSSNITYIAFTSKVGKILPVHVFFSKDDVDFFYKDSILLTEGVDTIDKSRFIRKLGTLTQKDLKRVANAMMMQMPLLKSIS